MMGSGSMISFDTLSSSASSSSSMGSMGKDSMSGMGMGKRDLKKSMVKSSTMVRRLRGI
jgi:hypothetical protein